MAHPDHDPDVGDVITVEWSEELALRAAGFRGSFTRNQPSVVDDLRDAIDDGRLPAQAVDALIAAGWTELAD